MIPKLATPSTVLFVILPAAASKLPYHIIVRKAVQWKPNALSLNGLVQFWTDSMTRKNARVFAIADGDFPVDDHEFYPGRE